MKILIPHWEVSSNIKTCIVAKCSLLDNFSSKNNMSNIMTHIKEQLKLPSTPIWLNQQHSNIVINTNQIEKPNSHTADGIISTTNDSVFAVYTADCVPMLITDTQSKYIGVIHIGWRGLSLGIIESLIEKITIPNQKIIAWLGPSISTSNYPVGNQTKEQILTYEENLYQYFIPQNKKKYLFNLTASIKYILQKHGVIKNTHFSIMYLPKF